MIIQKSDRDKLEMKLDRGLYRKLEDFSSDLDSILSSKIVIPDGESVSYVINC